MSEPKLTESDVTDLLRAKHTESGNGSNGTYAFLTQVRNAAGFSANRTFDAVAIALWESRGLCIDVFEVKVSRSDWARELKKPDKAEDACKIADRFWIVAPAGCVKPGELPATWGLIEVTGDGTDTKPWKLRTKTTAPHLHEGDRRKVPIPRGLVVGLLRAAPGAVPGGRVTAAHATEIEAARQRGEEQGRMAVEWERRSNQRATDDAAASWNDLIAKLSAAGLREWEARGIAQHAPAIVEAMRGVGPLRQLDAARSNLRNILQALDELEVTSA